MDALSGENSYGGSDIIEEIRSECERLACEVFRSKYAEVRPIGWRIDYFVVSGDLENKVEDSQILKEHWCSDHVPVRLFLSL